MSDNSKKKTTSYIYQKKKKKFLRFNLQTFVLFLFFGGKICKINPK